MFRKVISLCAVVVASVFVFTSSLVAEDKAVDPKTTLKDEIEKAAAVTGMEPDIHIVCSEEDLKCLPQAIYISAAATSMIEIKVKAPAADSTTKSLTVRVTAGETFNDGNDVFVEQKYEVAPDRIAISLHRDRWINPSYDRMTGGTNSAKAFLQKKAAENNRMNNPAISFLTFGRSPMLLIQLDRSGKTNTIAVPIKYQHWFVDTGGLLIFNTLSDQQLVTKTVSGQTQVTAIRRKDRLSPETGAVVDFHPANYPSLALQFGLATNADRQPTYFAGTGWRLREVGAKALATVSMGIAAKQVLRFPGIQASSDLHAPDEPALKGSASYRFGPYVAISFGFAFGNTPPAEQK